MGRWFCRPTTNKEMNYLTLSIIKQHLNFDATNATEDTYLTQLGDVAEAAIEKHLDCDLTDLIDGSGNLPAPIIQAMLLLVANYYNCRESVSFSSATILPYSFDYLLDFYKNYASGVVE